MDAYRKEVFAALYRTGPAGGFEPGWLTEIEGPTVGAPAATLKRWSRIGVGDSRAPISFLGNGAIRYVR